MAFFLPENMELVVFANSNLGVPPLPFRGTIRNLYLAHLGAPTG